MDKLNIDICDEEITISMKDGTEIVHWTIDEWEEDPTIVPAIANAIRMAHTNPEFLIEINKRHIDSIRKLQDECNNIPD